MGAQYGEKPPTDRRAVRTRAALTDAFVHLLDTTPYPKITISAIAREAGVNRKTFYLHYPSVDDLLRDLVRQSIYNSIDAVTQTLSLSNNGEPASHSQVFESLTAAILQQLAQNTTLNAHIVEHVPTNTLLEMATEPLRDLVRSLRLQRHASEVPHLNYLICCYLGSIIACYREWKREPEPRTPLKDVSALICDLFAEKARDLL